MLSGKELPIRYLSHVAIALVLMFSLVPFASSAALADEASVAALSSREEGRAAAVERVADAVELGYTPGEMVVVYEPGAADAAKEEALEAGEGIMPDEEAEFDTTPSPR